MNIQVYIKFLFFIIFSSLGCMQSAMALPNCEAKPKSFFDRTICKNENLNHLNDDIKQTYLNAQLMSNAPLNLLELSQRAWIKYVEQCKTRHCIQEQLELRKDELIFFMTMNQSLTQHFVRYKDNHVDSQYTYIQIQQLDKDRIKIEGTQYRNPNNSEYTRLAYLRAYTSPNELLEIIDLESKCKYKIERMPYHITFISSDQKCRRFTGLYKLYD